LSEQILIGRDDYPDLTQKEKERVWKYQKDRADSGQKECPYSRLPKGRKLTCKINGNRCHWGSDYVYCEVFQTWLLEDERMKEEEERLEDLSPISG
jgi:hypothetical protein